MATFSVNTSDPAHVMLDKLNSYVSSLKKEKYNNILKLLNELFESQHKTLRHFTEIEIEYFEKKSISKIIKILELHKSKFNYDIEKIIEYQKNKKKSEKTEKLEKTEKNKIIEITDKLDKTDKTDKKSNTISKTRTKTNSKKEIDEEFNISKEIFSIISKLLKSIEYKLIKFTKCNKQVYSIIMCQ